jgi:hypothetical protein
MAVTQGTEDRIDDLTLDKLVFASPKKGLSTGVGDLIDQARLEEALKGASQLVVELFDREYEALKSNLFKQRVTCRVDGVGFRLAQLSLVDEYKLAATFEHELIAEMRENTKPKKATRGSVTRAEFIYSMLRELKLPFRFICPELHRTQKTPAPEQIKETISNEPPRTNVGEGEGGQSATSNLHHGKRGKGVSKSNLTVKGQKMTDAQAAILTEALGAAEAIGSPQLAMEALVVALIQEADVSNPSSGDSTSKGALQVLASTAAAIQKQDGHGTLDPMDVAEVSTHFLVAGFYKYGGAITIAKAHPDYSPSKIGTMVEGPKAEYPSTWNAEASRIVIAYTGGALPAGVSSSASSSSTVVKTATFEFTRGQPEQVEDTFSCCQRLAEEVGWSFFVTGKKDIYFVNDLDLLKALPRYIVEPDSTGLESLTFDVEVGNRTTIQRGKRLLKPSEAVLTARILRHEAPPGTVIALRGWGPLADGKWLVEHVERTPFDPRTIVLLRKPQSPVEEPQATVGTSETATGAAAKAEALGHSGTANRSVEAKLKQEHPEIHEGVRRVVAIILTQFPQLQITSTTGGHHAPGSLHYLGRAVDLAGSNMDAIGTWIAHNLGSLLTEGIHDPTLSIKDGKTVASSFWGEPTWGNHANHIHVGV